MPPEVLFKLAVDALSDHCGQLLAELKKRDVGGGGGEEDMLTN